MEAALLSGPRSPSTNCVGRTYASRVRVYLSFSPQTGGPGGVRMGRRKRPQTREPEEQPKDERTPRKHFVHWILLPSTAQAYSYPLSPLPQPSSSSCPYTWLNSAQHSPDPPGRAKDKQVSSLDESIPGEPSIPARTMSPSPCHQAGLQAPRAPCKAPQSDTENILAVRVPTHCR